MFFGVRSGWGRVAGVEVQGRIRRSWKKTSRTRLRGSCTSSGCSSADTCRGVLSLWSWLPWAVWTSAASLRQVPCKRPLSVLSIVEHTRILSQRPAEVFLCRGLWCCKFCRGSPGRPHFKAYASHVQSTKTNYYYNYYNSVRSTVQAPMAVCSASSEIEGLLCPLVRGSLARLSYAPFKRGRIMSLASAIKSPKVVIRAEGTKFSRLGSKWQGVEGLQG